MTINSGTLTTGWVLLEVNFMQVIPGIKPNNKKKAHFNLKPILKKTSLILYSFIWKKTNICFLTKASLNPTFETFLSSNSPQAQMIFFAVNFPSHLFSRLLEKEKKKTIKGGWRHKQANSRTWQILNEPRGRILLLSIFWPPTTSVIVRIQFWSGSLKLLFQSADDAEPRRVFWTKACL